MRKIGAVHALYPNPIGRKRLRTCGEVRDTSPGSGKECDSNQFASDDPRSVKPVYLERWPDKRQWAWQSADRCEVQLRRNMQEWRREGG